MKYDFILDIATAHTRTSKHWRNRQWRWSELVEKCRYTRRTPESVAEYNRMSREEQSQIKDVGGFVGGYLAGGVRKTSCVQYRTVATLDIDYGNENVWDDFRLNFGFAAMIYSTHKHTSKTPRYRLVFPLSRQVSPLEYEPLCRKIAEQIGMDLFDDTTYETARLFYWPSTSRDGEYFFDVQDGPACDVDAILGEYVSPLDVSTWPMSSREGDIVRTEIAKAEDPTQKQGLIGAFCRAYTIEDVIEKFLHERYEATGIPGRYTYRMGSVAGGLVCYDGKYAYSHHDTDPASRRLCNAFDLVRLHLYGANDEGSRIQDVTRLPSYAMMQQLAADDENVRLLMTRERTRSVNEDFGDIDLDDDLGDEWMKQLDYSKSGKLQCTINNAILILENDRAFKGKLRRDLFSGTNVVVGQLPWKRPDKTNNWTDTDDSNLRAWMERCYNLTGKEKISDALQTVFTQHGYHPVRDYLNTLEWDGVPRLEKLVIDYIGAEDTELNRAMTCKHFTAAVARVMDPGCKYDHCLILAGPEGVGKSTMFKTMGGEWFSDSITTMEGKEGMSQLRKAWIIELSELTSIKRSEVEQVKAFLSKQEDIYRAAYDRHTTVSPRQCVFGASTNESYFLRGDTGHRRFWIIDVDPALKRKELWREALIADRDQLWAEAVQYYRRGETLYLDEKLEAEAHTRQETHNDDTDDPIRALLHKYLEMKLPPDWGLRDIRDRRRYINSPDPCDPAGTETRQRVCAAEFICEQLGKDIADKEYKYLVRRINRMIKDTGEWEELLTSRHAEKYYGRQRAFIRSPKNVNDDSI